MERSTKNNIRLNEGIHVCRKPNLVCSAAAVKVYCFTKTFADRLFAAPGTWTLLRCPKCGLVWLNPQPIPEDIGKLYSEYFTHNTLPEIPKQEPTKSWRKTIKLGILNTAFGYQNDNANKPLWWLASRFGPLRDIVGGGIMWLNGSHPGKLLDVGCGNGRFLATMQELGWEVTGVEPDGQAAKVAREQFSFSVHEGILEEIAFPDDTFDAITMNHVVEHLPDPISTLRECRRILKKGGCLVVTTPNIESLGHKVFHESWAALDPPRHLLLFSLQTLKTCAERSGFSVNVLRTTAHGARSMWPACRLIRRNGTLPGGSPPEQHLGLRLEGLAFQVVEHGLCMVRDAGEGVVMIADKREEV